MTQPVHSGKSIPLFNPEIRGNEWQYVKQCLDTAWVSSVGSFVDRFERELADYAGVKYAVATVNGTAALHVALQTAGVRPEDEVLVSTLTFIASANAIRYSGARPVFIDAESTYWQMDCGLVEQFLTRRCVKREGVLYNRASGRRVSAIVPVHILGHAVDMEPLWELARRFGLAVVADAAEALGVKYQGIPAAAWGDVSCVSFNGNKLITTGGGGAVLTNDQRVAERVRYLTTQAKDHPIEYVHGEIGYNYRLTNLQAAVGCGQLECLPDFIAAKQSAARTYREQLADIPGIHFYKPSPQVDCTFWMNTIRVDAGQYGLGSRELLRVLQTHGVQSRPLWQPMHQSPAHGQCESMLAGVADQLHAECLNIPSSVALTRADIEYVCRVIREAGAAYRSKTTAA